MRSPVPKPGSSPSTVTSNRNNPFAGLNVSIIYGLCVIGCMVFLGTIGSIMYFPAAGISGPSTNSIVSKAVAEVKVFEEGVKVLGEEVKELEQEVKEESMSLSKKILTWLPLHHWIHVPSHYFHKNDIKIEEEEPMPDYSQKFWSPIDIDTVPHDPIVTLCQLNFKEYSESPHLYPMFRDLEGLSNCHGDKRLEPLSSLLAEIKHNDGNLNGRVIEPSGFVFHESRVGSTLVANTLGSDPWNLVYSESSPSANALLHCDGCDESRSIQLFRDVVTIMGRTPFHKRLFLKFQSITSTKMDIALKAFPNTSWIFVYRSPVQTMMSHLDPKKGVSGAPCLRSMRDPPQLVMDAINSIPATKSPPREAWCAAHLNMLCSNAFAAYSTHSMFNDKQRQRGLLVNYESLPGIIPRLVLPMFGVDVVSQRWLHKMTEESSFYSKGRQSVRSFTGDSADKEERATHDIQLYSRLLLSPTFEAMEAAAYAGTKRLITSSSTPDLLQAVTPVSRGEHDIGRVSAYSWKALSTFPLTADHHLSTTTEPVVSASVNTDAVDVVNSGRSNSRHSDSFPVMPYYPWAPFANTHNSRAVRVVDCPATPPENYPQSYAVSEMVTNWNPDDTEIPSVHYDSLCHFDYQDRGDNAKAWAYRNAELPFVMYNVPDVDRVVKRWSNVDFLERKLGKQLYTTETSKDNHFMYHAGLAPKYLRGSVEMDKKMYVSPTNTTHVTFERWLENAVKAQNKTLTDRKHEYFRVSSNLDGGNDWLFDELPFFKPKKSLFIAEPDHQQGIHCRFGMRSVIAEAHFDSSRNTIAMIGGLRRWIIAHPAQCKHLSLLPRDHPSARHTEVDWSSQVSISKHKAEFEKLQGLELILQPGDVLYLPTFWIHYIVSLNVNVQCNSRSGTSYENKAVIEECMNNT
jgi:hypothetical protein